MDSNHDSFTKLYHELVGLLQTRLGDEKDAEAEERIQWLRSHVIGADAEFSTPFGRRALTYADHTASGRCLRFIEEYIVGKILPFYGNTHTSDSFVGLKTTRTMKEACAYVKRCMGGKKEDALVFCGSGSTAAIKRLQEVIGVAVPSTMRKKIVRGLKAEERWVVFVGPYEHHSNLLSWRQSTAEVVEISADVRGLIDLNELRVALESPEYANRPILGSFSACSNVTGVVTDTRAIARLLHEHGAFACFDFAASGPYVKIDMRSGEKEGYDAVFLSPHKFLGGPGSPGILLMNTALYQLASSPPSTCGGGTVSYVNGFSEKDTLYCDDIEEREDAGTPPIIQKIRASLAFWTKEYVGHGLIDLHENLYMEMGLKTLLSNPNICVLGNTDTKRLPVFSFLIFPSSSSSSTAAASNMNNDKPLNGRFVAKLLNDLFGIQARGGCACAGPYGHYLLGIDEKISLRIRSVIDKGYIGLKPGWTRVSFSYYTTVEECVFVLTAIEFVAMYGHRFLPLYDFDWISGGWNLRECMSKNGLVKGIAIEESLEAEKQSKNEAKMIKRYMSYLETAKLLAFSLSDEPACSRSVPNDISPDLILFRV